MRTDIAHILNNFRITGPVEHTGPVGNGWINDTYLVRTVGDSPDYILQRINHNVFKDVELLQRNIERVTSHIRGKLVASGVKDIDRRVLRLIPATDGKLYWYDGADYWRVMVYIADSVTYETINPRLAGIAGHEFGSFQEMLSDMEEDSLGQSIPDFHNMKLRLANFKSAAEKNVYRRLSKTGVLVDELLAREKEMCRAEDMYEAGTLPRRVTHCDTKVNNLLFDCSGQPLCVIDLDTVMPGFVLSDFGDFIRTGANTGAEDDTDLGRIGVDMDIFRTFARGYVDATRGFLTAAEREMLPFGAKMMTYMQVLRFLTDYLEGDTYYKIKSPEHNLERSHAQFRLLQCIERQEPEMMLFIESL